MGIFVAAVLVVTWVFIAALTEKRKYYMASEKTTVRQIVDSLNRGTVIFQEDDWSDLIKGTLTGMVANSEIVRCEHGEFVFYMAWRDGPTDSESDVAQRMALAINKL